MNTTSAPAHTHPPDAPGIHPWLRSVSDLIGTWQGRGRGTYPTLDQSFTFEQEITFTHDGRPFLHYEASAWLLDADGRRARPSGRESGWWRTAPDGRVEALFSHPLGLTEICAGQATTTPAGLRVDMSCQDIHRTPTAKEVTASRRLYRLRERTLTVSHQVAALGRPLSEHLTLDLRPATRSTPAHAPRPDERPSRRAAP